MWNKETVSESEIKKEYRKIINPVKRKSDSILYLNIQVFFSVLIIVMSFMFKNGAQDTFSYIKENYDSFFETDTYKESSFSYDYFFNNLKNEFDDRFQQLITVFNSKGKADIIPANASTAKYTPKEKGVIPASGYISSPYGIRNNPFKEKEKEFHTGIDIAAAKGTFIRAAFSGTVAESTSSPVAGNYIKIDSDDNVSTLYAHNQFLLVNKGDYVLAGQVIATMGETGMATGPHLHFEFIKDNTRYNPVHVLDF